MKKSNPFRVIFNSRPFWMIISLLVSFAIWIYVTSTDQEESTQTFRGIPVELVGEETLLNSRNLLVTDVSTSTVNVDISGPRRVLNLLNAADLVAQVDVSKLSQPAYASLTYTIVYPAGIDRRNLTVSSKTPDTVSFYVSQQTSVTVPVRGGFEGTLAEGHTAGSQQCHDGSHGDTHHIHRGENNDHREEDFDQVLQESPQGRLNGQQFLVAFKQFPDPVNQKKTDHKHQDAAEEVHTGFFQPTEDAVHIRADVRIHAAVLLLFCGFAVLVLQ